MWDEIKPSSTLSKNVATDCESMSRAQVCPQMQSSAPLIPNSGTLNKEQESDSCFRVGFDGTKTTIFFTDVIAFMQSPRALC